MNGLYNQLNQLPNFLQSEVTAQAGNLQGLSDVQIVNRYRIACEQLIVSKRSGLRQEHIDNAIFIWGNSTSTKVDVENRMLLRMLPGPRATDFFSLSIEADFFMQCIRFLTEFAGALPAIQARLEEEERQQVRRLAEEAARQQAQRLAEEEAARQLAQRQAEEAARRQAEELAAQQRAKEAAMQLAQRQIEEATLALAKRLEEEKASQTKTEEEHSSENTLMQSGPRLIAELETAVFRLRHDIDRAVDEFARTMEPYFEAGNEQHLAAVQNISA
jgi:flagellar biosynthesis GTPase FlhF